MRSGRTLPPKLRLQVLERDNHTCVACDDQNGPFDVDHITTVEDEGDNAIDNLRTLCKPCHKFRHLVYERRYCFREADRLELMKDPRCVRLKASAEAAPQYPFPLKYTWGYEWASR